MLRNRALRILLPVVFLVPALWGQCDKGSIKGSYGFVSSLTSTKVTPRPGGSPVTQHFKWRFIGLVSYNGAGNASASGFLIDSTGKHKPFSLGGTYEVSGCTGQVSLSGEDNSHEVWGFVIVNSGAELLTVSEKSSDTTPFSQKKQ